MFDSKKTAEQIKEACEQAFQPSLFELEDQSHRHKGHKSAGGGGHFFVTIRSMKFNGLTPLARQRLVIAAMGPMMDREIHALSMKCIPE